MDNIQKNHYVKEQITKAALRLLKDRELKDISIREIADVAQVNRVSFYRNYCSKEDIFQQYVYWQLREWQALYDREQPTSGDLNTMFGSLFAYLAEHKELYLLLYQRGLSGVLLASLKQLCGPKPEHSNLHAYWAGFMSYGLFGWIDEWFARGMAESADTMTALLRGGVGAFYQ